MKEDIRRLLEEYGEEILESEEFQKAYQQKHHKIMTVADHSLGVAIISLKICRLLEKLHIDIHERELIISALCHDLGILDRDEKYKNNLECCSQHPRDSIDIVRSLTGEENRRVEDSIRRHMWPLTLHPPKYREGFILTAADKISSAMERMGKSPAAGVSYKKKKRPVKTPERKLPLPGGGKPSEKE